jgi:CheY-like chemotaxis protein
MKVLVVDDNRVLANVVQESLEEEGLEVMTACSGREGYAVYLRFRPDVIVTDIQMPGINGLQMMAQIRAHEPAVRTVYMSGNIAAYRSLLEEEKEHHPVHYLEKPFSMNSLTTLIAGPEPGRPVDHAWAVPAY